ncbi:DUF3017 domain-containing protein [Nakamurella antarctica]|uniref:DUF3017 domain-containing protein n=1 Tax=Nakamurella antarctica TaxID=1902245 RepID=UPI0013DE2D33|nr:DUF3017 domain-containing protein [Nakamurella antarctica]
MGPPSYLGHDATAGVKARGSRGKAASTWPTAVPMLMVLALIVVGLLLISQSHWRRGAASIAGAVSLAALLRLFVAPEKLGPLVVRSKPFDIGFCVLVAFFLIALGSGWLGSDD